MFTDVEKCMAALSGKAMSQQVAQSLPETLKQAEKELVALKVEALIDKQTSDLKIAHAQVKADVNARMQALATSTKDLEKVPILGSLGLLLRGLQRPIWSLALLFIDLKVLSGAWKVEEGSQLDAVFWLLNLLILGFLFGERAAKNVLPVINRQLGRSSV
ncbi:MAG: hypothetical protein ACPG4U_11525 [Pseudomonadales bacterium]